MDDTRLARVAAVHVVRCSRLLAGIARLSASGYAVEAATLVRSILEDVVSLAYMSLDPETRSEEWVDHDDDLSYMYLKRARQLGHSVPDNERTRDLDKAFASRKPRLWWSGKTPSQMADSFKDSMPEVYGDFAGTYDLLSGDAHGNFKSGERYVVGVAGELQLVVGPSNHLIDERIPVAIHLARRLVAIAVELGVNVESTELDRVASAVAVLHPLYRAESEEPEIPEGQSAEG